MKIEAVVVCDRYADFLAETILHHRAMFNRLVVVTSYEDNATRRLCEHWHVQCVPTDVLGTRKGEFCKGAGINVGLAALDRDAWMVHMDADIILPPLTRPVLEKMDLSTDSIYGVDRFMVRNHDEWRAYMEAPRLQHENGSWLHTSAFDIGTRVVIPDYEGWLPLGFFQMWHADSGIKTYPADHNTAARTDLQFALQWPRKKRVFLPEIITYHLESEHAPMASNWSGRQTVPFTHDGRERKVYQPMQWQERRRAQQQAKQTDPPPAATPDQPSYE